MATGPQPLAPPGEPIPPPTLKTPTQPQKPPHQRKLRPILAEADAYTVAALLAQAGLHQDAHRVSICRQAYTVALCRNCHRTKHLPYHCDHPLCPHCAAWRAEKRAGAIRAWIQAAWRPKHVVLTTPHTQTPLAQQLARIKQAFRRLRRTKWAHHWKGGVWRVEITPAQDAWHVHIHAIIDAGWIDQRELSRRWGKLIGHPQPVVWVGDLERRSQYTEAAKYTVKPADLQRIEPQQIPELLAAIRKHRLYGTWGTAHNAANRTDREQEEPEPQGLVCECGASDWEFYTDTEWEAFVAIHGEPEPLPLKPNGNNGDPNWPGAP